MKNEKKKSIAKKMTFNPFDTKEDKRNRKIDQRRGNKFLASSHAKYIPEERKKIYRSYWNR